MFDLKEIKSIKCEDVARKCGIKLTRKHNRFWGKLRNEKTESFSINPAKNLWYDFGEGKGGSVIDLLMEIESISKEEAINRLAEDYGIAKEKSTGWRGLTDSQYKELGIQPERATMNFKIDLTKHSIELVERWEQKYSMPVKELAIKEPVVYNNMINKIGMENINVLRDSYLAKLKIFHDPGSNKATKEFAKYSSIKDAEELNRKVDLLQRAVTTVNISYIHLKVDHEKDFGEKTQNQDIQKNVQEKIQEIKNRNMQDEKIRERIASVYKRLFNYELVGYFSIEQVKALKDINFVISQADNKFVPIDVIKKTYKMLGNNLEKIENDYKNIIIEGQKLPRNKENPEYQKWEEQTDKIRSDMLKVRDLFCKCNTIIEGIKEANLTVKNEIAKQNVSEKSIEKTIDMSI